MAVQRLMLNLYNSFIALVCIIFYAIRVNLYLQIIVRCYSYSTTLLPMSDKCINNKRVLALQLGAI